MAEIVKLAPDDWQELQTIRLRAVKEEPYAFGKTFEEESAKSAEDFKKQLTKGSFYVARDAGQTVGMICLKRQEGKKQEHMMRIFSVYVNPESRGKGIARALMDAVLNEAVAQKDIVKIRLSVAVTQRDAQKLYGKAGFEQVGLLRKELFLNGEYVDVIMMEKFLS